jgi:23S rRNA (cytosine1962-C5)-methyltransferase
MPLPLVILNRHVQHRVLHGHLWIYATEVARVEGTPAPGDLVEVHDSVGSTVGWGFYNAASKIVIRLLTRHAQAIDPAFFKSRLEAALRYRDQVMPGRQARRLVNSESDLLPGLIVDQYGDVLVIQTTTLGMDRLLTLWVDLLRELCSPRAILERNDVPIRTYEGLEQRVGLLFGEKAEVSRMRIGQLDFPCDPYDAHKTGAYLDQQCNWEQVATMVRPGMRVLDAFCHVGGFGLHALKAGAAQAVFLDSAEAALVGARQAAAWAGFQDRCVFHQDNAFSFLKNAEFAGEQFDLIILDPPSFTRSRAAVENALRGYKEIHLRALKMLRPGGRLATFTCSHHVDAPTFFAMTVDAAADVHRLLRRDAILTASPDHPVVTAIAESEYLKGLILTILDG